VSVPERAWVRATLAFDVFVTLALTAAALWFAYQYGFTNSPDSWYRGLLAKSIIEGHPYWVNVKQGYAYEYGAWHHDATHEPFLPLLYAVSFLLFGTKISVANVICAASAGLVAFPLLRLSRALTGSMWPAVVVYVAVIFNEPLSYLFEMSAGLSLPTTLLTFVLFFWGLERLVERPERRWIAVTALSAASYYLIRGDSQLIFLGLLLTTLVLGRWSLPQPAYARLRRMWLWAFVLVLPWMLRKLVLFGSPLFSHMTPLVWTDRGYDYFSYHETTPFLTPGAYFATHTVGDFVHRLLVVGPGHIYDNFTLVLPGPPWWFAAAFVAVAVVTAVLVDARRRFVFVTLWLAVLGYLAVYCIMTILEPRYMIPPYWAVAFTLAAAPFVAVRGVRGWTGIGVRFVLGAALLGAVLWWQQDFWRGFRGKYLRGLYTTSDQRLAADPLVEALRKRFTTADMILGPFSEVQYLSFATGLTFVELPDNLKSLNDPVAFFEKFGIRYALVDVQRALPKEMIEKVEILGNRPLYTIGKGTGRRQSEFFAESNLLEDEAIKAAIATGVRNRVVYVDAYHGNPPPEMANFRDAGTNPFTFQESLVTAQQKLFQSGVFVLQYANGKARLADDELAVIKRYVANGGRVALFCPAWVWLSYERQPLEELSCFKIAGLFGLLMTGEYIEGPYRIAEPALDVPTFPRLLAGTFSAVLGVNGRPVLVGRDDKVAAAAAELGQAKVIAWGQNNLLGPPAATPEGRQFMQKLLDWLLS
jgi:hypothetical protein